MLRSYDDHKLLVLAWAYGQCPHGEPGLAALDYIRAGRGFPRGREGRERTMKKVLNKTACEKSSSIVFFLAGEVGATIGAETRYVTGKGTSDVWGASLPLGTQNSRQSRGAPEKSSGKWGSV